MNNWTAALAIAPNISLEYWKLLSNNYALYLQNNMNSEDCIPYLLSIGKDAQAIDFYIRRKDTYNAMIIAKMSENRNDLIPDYTLNNNINKINNHVIIFI